MKVAVLSDIHDNIWNLEKALGQVAARDVGALLFLGDFCAPFTLAQMAEGFRAGPVHAVFGNNDGDRFLLASIAAGHPHVTLHGELAEIDLAGVKVGLNHYPDIARRLAESGAYGCVFSGHDHRRAINRVGGTLWANPGEVMGRFGEPSFGLCDLGAGTFEHVDI